MTTATDRGTPSAAEPLPDDLPPFAGLRERCLAGLVDFVPTVLVIAPLAAALGGWGFVLGMVVVCIGFALFEGRGGRTPGKRLLHLRVLHLDGTPCTRLGAGLRNTFRVLDAFPGFYLLAMVSIAGSKRRQRLGDQAAGTSVFRDR
jgi:uncharacterized RDD family membrane protein YckC